MGKLLLVLVAVLVVAGAFMAVDAGHGEGNGFSDAAGCAQGNGLLSAQAPDYGIDDFLRDASTAAGCVGK